MTADPKRQKTTTSTSSPNDKMSIQSAAGRLGKNTLFMVCDVQDVFRKAIYNMDHIIATSSFLVDAAKILDIKCVATEQNPDKLGATCSEIDLKDIPVYPKTQFSMLTPEVRKVMADVPGPNRACVLFGIESHVCVFQTAMDLLAEKEFDVHIVTDGVSSSRALFRDTALQRLKQEGAYLTTSETVLFDIMKDSTHPQFRQVSKLIKAHNSKLSVIPSTL